MKKNIDEQYEALKNQMFKAIFNKNNPSINTKRVNKIAAQMRYLEKFVRPEVKEATM